MVDRRKTGIGTRTLFVGAAVVIVIAGLKAAQTLVIPFLLALFLAIICSPAVTWMTLRRVPAALAGNEGLDELLAGARERGQQSMQKLKAVMEQ